MFQDGRAPPLSETFFKVVETVDIINFIIESEASLFMSDSFFILGVDKKGQEFYQVTLGGSSNHDATIGDILGPSFAAEDMADVIEEIINIYLDNRQSAEETFLQAYRRLGIDTFKERVYAKAY